MIRDRNNPCRRLPSGSVDGRALRGPPEGRPERHRKLQQRERVALRIHEDAAANRRGKVRVAGVEQLARRRLAERLDDELREAEVIEELLLARPRRADQADPAAVEASCDETEHLGARSVQPGQVVDDKEQGPGLGRLAKQHEGRIRYDEPAGRHSLAETKRHVQRIALGLGQPRQRVEQREQELIQAGEADARLELDARGAEDPHPGGRRDGGRGVEELGLAHTGIAGDPQRAAVCARRAEERPDAIEIRLAPDEIRALTTAARPFVALGDRDLDQGSPAVSRTRNSPGQAVWRFSW